MKNWKKGIALLGLCGICFGCVGAAWASETETKQKEETKMYGDVNGDGIISAEDALLVLKDAVEISLLDDTQKVCADVDKNGEVEALDALYILQYVVRLRDNFTDLWPEETAAPTDEPKTTAAPTETPEATGEPTETPEATEEPIPAVFDVKYIPKEYRKTAAEEQGTITKITYQTDEGEKYALAYLPYGYDENDTETKYNIFYLMHGGGNTVDTIFNGEYSSILLRYVLDHMIENGELEPLIVVTPTFCSASGDGGWDKEQIDAFPEEFVNELVPAVEGQLHTYAETTDAAGLIASRGHRAFGGFSMGSATTWNMFADCLPYIRYFMPMSGDCWAYAIFGGSEYAEETVEYLINCIKESGFTKDDFYIYALTGLDDMACDAMYSQMEAAMLHPEMFTFSEDQTNGNIFFNVSSVGKHSLDYCYHYIYTALPSFWGNAD